MAELCRYDDGRCRSPQGCGDMRRCLAPPPLSDQARAIRYLTGIGEFDTNDPCDEWIMP